MQSILQRRRAAQAVQAQIDRDVEKARNVPAESKTNDILAGAEPAADGTHSPSSNVVISGAAASDGDPPPPPPAEDLADAGPYEDIEFLDECDLGERVPGERFVLGVPVRRITSAQTRHSERTALGRILTGVHVRNRHSHEGHGDKVFVVHWEDPTDPLNPHNWSVGRRVAATLQISLIAIAIGAASGIDATVLPQAAADLGVSDVAESLATGLYLAGMGVGALIAGPFSETFGRNAVYLVSLVVYMIWIMASGLAPNFGAQITFRFLAGCSASTPLVCSGGSIADMFDSVEKTWAFPLYSITSFGGPMLGAVMGAYIGPSDVVSSRWSEWSVLIATGLVLVLVLLFMPETYGPLLLQWRAEHYRRITGDHRFVCNHEIISATLFSRLKISMTRPFLMLTEPIIMITTLYLTILYIILFTFLVGWPYLFEATYSLGQGLSNSIFVSMFIGTEMNFLLIPIVYHMTMQRVKGSEDHHLHAETRLWYGMLGASISIPVSLFWLGWTNYANISIWSGIVAVAFFGFGVNGIFTCVYMYIIDSYQIYAASALAFVTLTRYLVAGGMTVVGIPFYKNLGTHYTLTILACLAVLLAPAPYLLYVWGPRIRAKSNYAVSA